MTSKETGSFYTPEDVVNFMARYIKHQLVFNNALEPSAGDGAFLRYLNAINCNTTAVEIDNEKIEQLKSLSLKNVSCISSDYLDFTTNQKFDLVIGNPPFVIRKRLSDHQIKKSLSLVNEQDIPESVFQNLWVSFILKSLELVSDEGSIFFVLPYEFLQVDYATTLRNHLENKFQFIEIIVFQDRVFPDVDQEVCLVLLSNQKFTTTPYISLKVYTNTQAKLPLHEGLIERNKPIKKWSNSILTDEELEFLKCVNMHFPKGDNCFTSYPGIVTAANDFFIVDQAQVEKLNAMHLVEPIISKSYYVGNKLSYKYDDFQRLASNGKKTYILNLSGKKYVDQPYSIRKYLKSGKDEGIHKRYKCQLRKRWYDMRMGERGHLLFFRRYHLYPRLIINDANIYTTDIAYNLFLQDHIDAASFAFCFYNSLTLTMCEYNGRFYGGGVCELMPVEFRNLPFPYIHVSREKIAFLDKLIRNNSTIQEITNYVDSIVLKDHLDKEELKKIALIKSKLMFRRLRSHRYLYVSD